MEPTRVEGRRWFTVSGRLVAGGQELMLGEGAHADDLAPSPFDSALAQAEIAERVRRLYAARYGDPEAVWAELRVLETPRENVFDVKLPFL